MFTKNFKKLMSLYLLNGRESGLSEYTYQISTTLKALDGTVITTTASTMAYERYSLAYALSDVLSTEAAEMRACLAIGTGTGTVSDDDYQLFESTSDCTCVSASSNTSANFNKIYTATFQNDTSADITITETGMVTKSFLYNKFFKVLLDHTLLDTPVIIPAGESRTITYEWVF